MSEQTTVQNNKSGFKNFIVAKQWLNSQDGRPGGAIVFNRNLPQNINISAGARMLSRFNNKRPGMNDPDITLSILLPEAEANRLIEASRVKEIEIKAELAAKKANTASQSPTMIQA